MCHRAAAKGIIEITPSAWLTRMADQIGEQHQPAGETDLPDADAADEFFELISEDMVMRSIGHRQ
jgi:hypothetical protein